MKRYLPIHGLLPRSRFSAIVVCDANDDRESVSLPHLARNSGAKASLGGLWIHLKEGRRMVFDWRRRSVE
jgi:hypothetical protein